MSLVACRYNPNHKMKPTRLLIHEGQCPDRYNKVLKVCPYNPVHKLSPEMYEKHKKECPQRPKIDEDVEKELKEYLQAKANCKVITETAAESGYNSSKNGGGSEEEKTNVNLEGSEKDYTEISQRRRVETQSKPAQVIGLRKSQNEKTLKKERKIKQREMMHLIENDDFEESGVFDRDINAIDYRHPVKSGTDQIDALYDTIFDSSNIAENINVIPDQSPEDFNNNSEYDPNSSDFFIDSKNKNIIPRDIMYDPRLKGVQNYNQNYNNSFSMVQGKDFPK